MSNATIRDSDVIVLMDAYDVVVSAPIRNIAEHLAHSPTPIVYCAENGVYPDASSEYHLFSLYLMGVQARGFTIEAEMRPVMWMRVVGAFRDSSTAAALWDERNRLKLAKLLFSRCFFYRFENYSTISKKMRLNIKMTSKR